MSKTNDNKIPIIDWGHQAKEETDNPLALAKELFSLFVEQLPIIEKEIKIALKQKDPEKLHAVLHRFHGACAYCGLARLDDAISKTMEILKQTNQVVPTLIKPVRQEIAAALQELKKIGVMPFKKSKTKT